MIFQQNNNKKKASLANRVGTYTSEKRESTRKWELFWVGGGGGGGGEEMGGCMGCEGGGGKVRFKVIILTLKRVQKGRL